MIVFKLNNPHDRGTFFRQAYKYVTGKIECDFPEENQGGLASVLTVEPKVGSRYVVKINDYVKLEILAKNKIKEDTLPNLRIDLDKKAKAEIEFLLKLKSDKFNENDGYRLITKNRNNWEGVSNIIEIIGYGKIDCGDLMKRNARNENDIPVPADESYNNIPFRFYEMPCLNAIDDHSFYCLVEALSLGADISNALCCVHDERLFNVACHGDIKITNILYDNTGDKYDPYQYILTDFNTVHHDMEDTRITEMIGTPNTMPPEMFCGEGGENPEYSYTVDHYSLAATMYCMLNSGIYPKPNGEIRLVKGDKKPYSYPGFDTDYDDKYPKIYVDPRDASSQNRVIEMLTRNGFGENEAVVATGIYLFIVTQLEFDKDKRAIYKDEDEKPVDCTRRVKYKYLAFLNELGEACLKDEHYDRAIIYYGRYISRQERELQYCKMDSERKGEIEKICCDLNSAKCNMGLALIRSDVNEDYDKVMGLAEELGDSLYERGLENAFEYGAYLASPENEDFHVLMECMDREKDKRGNYRIFYDKEKWDILTLAFQALQEVDEDNKERDDEILKALLRDLPANVELPNSIKTSINGLAEKVSYTVKYEVEKHPELAPDEKKYTAYYLKNEKYVENLDLVSKVVGYKVDEEHSSYPKQGDLLQNGVKYVIKYVKDPEQTKKIKFTVRYQCDGTVFFSEEKEYDLWIKDEMHYDESLDKIPEQFADAYSFKSVNKERGAVISDGEKIFVDCEIKYVDTEYIVKHICDGQEVSEDTTSFKSCCWAGKNTKTVTLTKEALQPRTYNGYEYFKILPENAAAGNVLEDHAEIQLLYRKDSDAEKTVFYAVTYYKDGEECDSVIQRKQVWSGAADRLEIQSGALGAERYDGYLLDHVEPDIKEGDEISSGSLINVYYVANPEVQDGFEIEDNTLIQYTGKAKQIVIPNGIEVIGPGAFSAHKELKDVEFPKSLKTIGNSAFINCSSLAEVKFPEGLRTIGLGAFYGCNSLNSIEFPASLQYIGSWAFGNCTALKGTIYLHETMVQVYKDAFEGCPSINVIREKQSAEIGNQTSNSESARSTVDTHYIVEHVTEDENGNRKKYAEKSYASTDWSDKSTPEIMIRSDSLRPQKIEGYSYSKTVSSSGIVAEGKFVPSGTIIKLYYKKIDSRNRTHKTNQNFSYSSPRKMVNTCYTVEHVTEDENGKRNKFAEKSYASTDWGDKDTSEIMIRPDSLRPKKIEGYSYYKTVWSGGTPKEGMFVSSGTVIRLYYKKIKNENHNAEKNSYSASSQKTVDTYYIVEHVTEDGIGKRRKYAEKRYTDKDWGDKARPEIMIRPDSLNAKNISGYTYSRIVSSNGEPKEGSSVPSGTVIKLYYVKDQAKEETSVSPKETNNAQHSKEKCVGDFVIKGSTLVTYKGEDTHVKIPDGVTVIGEKAFSKCKFIETITFPESLQKIESYAFAACTSLKGTLKLPDGVSEIGDGAFKNCTSVDWIDMPRRTKLGKNVFYGCKFVEPFRDSGYITSLKSIVLALLAVIPGYLLWNQYEFWISLTGSSISLVILFIVAKIFLKNSDQTRFEAPVVGGSFLVAASALANFWGWSAGRGFVQMIGSISSNNDFFSGKFYGICSFAIFVLSWAFIVYFSQIMCSDKFSNLRIINSVQAVLTGILSGLIFGVTLLKMGTFGTIKFSLDFENVLQVAAVAMVCIIIRWIWCRVYYKKHVDITRGMYLSRQDKKYVSLKLLLDIVAIVACGGCIILMNQNVWGIIASIVIYYMGLFTWNNETIPLYANDKRKPRVFCCTAVGTLTLYVGLLYTIKLTNTIMKFLMKNIDFIGQYPEIFMYIFTFILGIVISYNPLYYLWAMRCVHWNSSDFWGVVITILFMVVIPMVLTNVVFQVSADSLQGGIIVIGSIICGVYLLQTMSWIKYKLDLRKARSSN